MRSRLTILLVVCASAFPRGEARACDGVPCLPTSCLMDHLRTRPLPTRGPQARTDPPYDSRNVTLLSHLSLDQIGGPYSLGSSLYGWVDPLTQREYAIMGRSNGTAFVDITNPTQPKYVANLPPLPGSFETLWREPKVYQNYAYIGVDGTDHRMQIVDLTQLRNYAGSTMTLSASTYTGGVGSLSITHIHTLAINKDSGFLYAAGTQYEGAGTVVGLNIIDVRNPANPVYAGRYEADNYTHETQVVTYHGPDTRYQGREIAFNSNGKSGTGLDTFSIADVTNKSGVIRISARTYPDAGFTHQGWLTEDHRYFFLDDEFDESNSGGYTRTHLWDLSDLTLPQYKGYFQNTTTSIDHNMYVKDGYVYQTNYTTGLRILQIGNLASDNPSDWLTEVAYFDTYPYGDFQGYYGAWNNYPFFPSGNIAVSDIDGGLFILRAEVPEPGVSLALLLIGVAMPLRRCRGYSSRL